MVIKGVVDNTLLHVRTEGRHTKIKGEVQEMVSALYFIISLGNVLWE